MRKIVVAILVLFAVMSCVSLDCPVQNKVETTYVLKKPDGSPDTLKTDTLSVRSHRITYKDNERDTLLINRLCGDKGTTFSIPVSHTLSEDSIFTLLKDTLGHQWFDTICIRKEDSPHFESVDCHATYFHRITEVSSTHHGIDSLSIHSREVNYDSQEHFYLYLKADR
jgi:hypothetical protein